MLGAKRRGDNFVASTGFGVSAFQMFFFALPPRTLSGL
jgi:hypothetical protein